MVRQGWTQNDRQAEEFVDEPTTKPMDAIYKYYLILTLLY